MIFLGLWCLAAQAAPTVTTPSTVLVIRTEASPDIARREQRLYEQLSLALDDFAVMLTAPPSPGFAELRLPEQVAIALTEAESASAVAVAWLVLPAPKQVMVHLVARNTGRTLVKTVEATTGPNAEATLAVVVRELLGTAFLLEPQLQVPASVQSVVRDVRAQVAQTPQPPAAPVGPSAEPLRWRAAAVMPSRFGGQRGPGVSLGATLSRHIWGGERWAFSALLQLDVGPIDSQHGLFLLEGSAGADVFFSLSSRVRLGPFVDVQAGGRFHRAEVGPQGLLMGAPTLRGHLGLRAVVPVMAGLGLVLELAVGARALPLRLTLGDETLWREGVGLLRAGVGVSWEGP